MEIGDRVRVVKNVHWENRPSNPSVWTRRETTSGGFVGNVGFVTHIAELERPEHSALVKFENAYGGASFWFSELENTSSG